MLARIARNTQCIADSNRRSDAVSRFEQLGRIDALPPISAMQSVVHSNVVVPKLVTALFTRLTSVSSEFFLFDVNRDDALRNLLDFSFGTTVWGRLERPIALSSSRSFETKKIRHNSPAYTYVNAQSGSNALSIWLGRTALFRCLMSRYRPRQTIRPTDSVAERLHQALLTRATRNLDTIR